MPSDTETTDQQDQRDAGQQSDESTEALGDAGKAALDRERAERKAAEKRARDAQKELDDLKADAQKRADAEAAEQGEWKTLAETREASLTATTTERDGLKARVETLEALAADRLKALLADLPKEIAALGPDDDTPVETRLAWAEKATKAAATVAKDNPGNRPNPKPAGNTKPDLKGTLPKRQFIN